VQVSPTLMMAGLFPWMLIDGGVVVPEIVGGVEALIWTVGVPERTPAGLCVLLEERFTKIQEH
jgi:hypothetical protein